jgi:hypothetical protein
MDKPFKLPVKEFEKVFMCAGHGVDVVGESPI